MIKKHQNYLAGRLHYIQEWIDLIGLKQADIARALGVDKGTVSRWCKGDMPENKNLRPLIDFLKLQNPSDLFRHPDEIWMRWFFEGRSFEEIDHIRRSLLVTFPRKDDSNGRKWISDPRELDDIDL